MEGQTYADQRPNPRAFGGVEDSQGTKIRFLESAALADLADPIQTQRGRNSGDAAMIQRQAFAAEERGGEALPPLSSGELYSQLRYRPSVTRGSNRKNMPEGAEIETIGIDWMRWSGPSEQVEHVRRYLSDTLDLSREEWQHHMPGFWFYAERYSHPYGVNICFTSEKEGRNCEHCTIELTGDAIQRAGVITALEVNRDLAGRGFAATRFDVYVDWEGEDIQLIEEVHGACNHGHLCMLRSWSVQESTGDSARSGYTVYLGSRQSDVLYRFYDKGLEQGGGKSGVWIRAELELKKERSRALALELAQLDNGYQGWEALAAGVWAGHVDFREGSKQQRRSSRRQCDFWKRLIEDIESIRYRVTRTKTDMDRHREWLRRCVFPLLQAVSKRTDLDMCQMWDELAADVEPMVDADTRPLVWEYVQYLRTDGIVKVPDFNVLDIDQGDGDD